MTTLITGGTGFIGSHLAETLQERDEHVVVVDNYATSRRDALANAGERLELREMDITDETAMGKLFDEAEPDRVVHCAASYNDPDAWARDLNVNAQGTVNVVRGALDHDVTRFIYFQTALCYGNYPEEQPITLDHPLNPESSYAISKTTGEQYIALSGLDFVSFRLANIYGPRNLSGPIPTFYQRLSQDKSCFAVDTRRDYIYVDDIVPFVLKALEGQGEGYYHISTGSDYAIKDVYSAVADALGVDEPVEERPRGEDDAPTILLDPSRTKEDFGWEATTPLKEGIRKTVEWYEDHGVGQTFTHLRHED